MTIRFRVQESCDSSFRRGGRKAVWQSLLSSAAVLGIAMSAVPSLGAESNSTAAASSLPEVTVTAEFRKENVQSTPIAVTAVNAAMMEKRGQTSIYQLANEAPNVTLRPQPQNGGAGLIAFIRGVGQVDFNYALDPGVGIYVDDVYIPTLSSSLLDLMDLDRVEILRGPQGTLAGKNAIGGAIKLFSQQPKGDGSGSVSVGYGSYNSLNVRAMADVAVTDNLAVRVSGMSTGQDGYVSILDYANTHPNSNVPATNGRGWSDINASYQSQGGQNHIGGRIAAKWEPTDKLTVNMTGDYIRENDESLPVVLIAAGQPASPFNPSTPWAAIDANGTPLLVGKNGAAVPLDCHFVPAGPYSCDTGRTLPAGVDPRFVSYSTFLDGMTPTTQAPFKPYFSVPITQFRGWGVQGHVDYDFSDHMQFTYIGSYRAYLTKWGQDQDATPIPVAQLDNRMKHNAWSQELRLNFQAADGLVEGTVGGFYMKQDGEYNARVDLNYTTPTIDFIHGPDTTPSSSKAVFGTVTLHPTMKLSITGGIRYTKDQKTYTYYRSNPDHTIPDPVGCFVTNGIFSEPNCLLAGLFGISSTYKGSHVDYRGVVNYQWTDHLMTYASISTGYKGGGVNPRPFVSDQRHAFNPETLTTYEIGFKTDLLDQTMRINGAAFYNKYKDIVLTKLVCPDSSLPFPCLRPENIGSADVKGVELETTIYPVMGLSIDGSLSYLDFKYTSPSTGGFLNGSAIPANGITPYTPKLTYSIGVQYDYDIKPGTISARFDGSYQDKLYTTSENTSWSEVPSYFLGNARLSFKTEKEDWEVALEVKNLFDKYYWQSVSDASASVGVVTGVPGMPRTWMVSLKRNF